MKSKHILTLVAVAVVALIGGYRLGSNETNNLAAVSGVTNAAAPADLAGQANFNQFWDVWRAIEERHPDGTTVSTQEKIWGATQGLVDSLDDPYSIFLPPKENEEFSIDLKGEFSGVGMEVGMKEGLLTVIAPLKDSPAEHAGILAGDIILKIDDTVASDLDVDEAVDLIRGKEGTPVVLTIARPEIEGTKEITVIREVIKLPTIETEYMKDRGVFLINFFSFGEKADEEFEQALEAFKDSGSKRLIIDLRNNPGGYLSAAVDITSWFLPEGKVIVREKSKDPRLNRDYKAGGHFMSGTYKVVVLVNEGSASASEIMAGALQEHGIAKLVGTTTFGKGSVQELIPMKNGTSLKLTIAEWLTPNGTSISKQGLKPDYEIELDVEKLQKDGTDTQLEKAIEVVSKK